MGGTSARAIISNYSVLICNAVIGVPTQTLALGNLPPITAVQNSIGVTVTTTVNDMVHGSVISSVVPNGGSPQARSNRVRAEKRTAVVKSAKSDRSRTSILSQIRDRFGARPESARDDLSALSRRGHPRPPIFKLSADRSRLRSTSIYDRPSTAHLTGLQAPAMRSVHASLDHIATAVVGV
jgi:hypothetical protein